MKETKQAKEKYIGTLRKIETFYEFGTIFLFAFSFGFLAITLIYASIVSFVFMGIFAFNKVRIMKKIDKLK